MPKCDEMPREIHALPNETWISEKGYAGRTTKYIRADLAPDLSREDVERALEAQTVSVENGFVNVFYSEEEYKAMKATLEAVLKQMEK